MNYPNKFLVTIMLAANLMAAGCAGDSYTAKGARQGAASGAMAGAVGGMVTALVFGGDIVDAGARGAVYGGTAGAVAGGVSGSRKDKAVAAQKQAAQDAELDQLRKSIGMDAFNGIEALADCKHDIAIANAREARNSSNRDFALAGLWIEALTEADRNDHNKAQALYPTIVAQDRDIKTAADAEATMREALKELGDIRVEYGQAAICS
jgi:hypothetical protein